MPKLSRSRFTPAERLRDIRPFRVMTVLERARALEASGRHIVHLEVGEPDFVTAAPILEAGRAALARGHTGYTPAAGLPELRERIAAHYLLKHGVTVAPGRIFVTPGASGALTLLAQMLLDPGDEVLMPDPGYPCNRNFVRLTGAHARLVPVDAQNDFQLTVPLLEKNHSVNTRGVWVASPGNPTGTILSRENLQALEQWCSAHEAHLLVDEIYHGLDYTDGLPTALEVSDDILVVNSFSKYFGMTGWRLGWFVVPEVLVPTSNILAQNLFIAASTVAQHAALRAFDPDTLEILEERRQAFALRRDFLSKVLIELGFSVPSQTRGAFYIYAGIEKFSDDSEYFCHALLENFGVAITPGTDFGDYQNKHYVRFAFTTSMEQLEVAAQRLSEAVVSGKLTR